MAKASRSSTVFSDDDAERLDELLYPRIEHGGLPLEAVDGLLSCVAVCPEMVMPSEWLPLVLGDQDEPWQNDADAQVFIDLVMRLHNHIGQRVVPEPDDATSLPLIALPEGFDAMDAAEVSAIDLPIGGNWAAGFMLGTSLRPRAWDALAAANESIRDDLAMIVALLPEDKEDAGDERTDETPRETSSPRHKRDEEQAETSRALDISERFEIIGDLPAALHEMNLARLDSMSVKVPLRRENKTGRNEACPCGSGKKFKKCHGASIH